MRIKNPTMYCLILIIITGISVRLAGINFLLFPDEAGQLYKVLRIGRLQIVPNYFMGVYSYIMFFYYSAFFLLGLGLGWFSSLPDFLGQYYTNPHVFYLAGRTAESLAGAACIYALYVLGRRMFNKSVGLIAAFFLALNITHVQISQLARGQAFCSFFSILSLYFMYLIYTEGRLKDYIPAGLCIAAAVSIRINYLSLFIPLFTAFVFTMARGKKSPSPPKWAIVRRFFFCALIFAAALCLFVPDIVVDLKALISYMSNAFMPLSQVYVEDTNYLGMEVINGWRSYLLNFIPASFGWPLYVVSLAGLLFALYSLKKFKYAFLSLFIITYIAIMGKSSLTATRYMIPIFPAFFLIAANLVYEIIRRYRAQGTPLIVLTCLIPALLVVPSAAKVIKLDISSRKKVTQDVAKEWILANIPDGARIAVESTGYAGPNIRLYSVIDYDIYMMPVDELKQLYAQRLKDDPSGSMALKYFIEHPPRPWHKVYNLAVKEKISIDYLEEEKVEYFVISSGVYDDYQSPVIRAKYPELVRSRMQFYSWLDEEGEMIKAFRPSDDMPGPEIKIYRMPLEGEQKP